MMIPLMLMVLSSNTVITIPAGHFDYSEYETYCNVFEAEYSCRRSGDRIIVDVSRVWKGDLTAGEQTGLVSDFRVHLERDSTYLFVSDSAGNLIGYGKGNNGFYIMAGRASPSILTTDDLDLLSRGIVPDFNMHESVITVHMPLTGETAEIRVVPGENLRTVVSDIEDWNGAYALGSICHGPDDYTDLILYPSGEKFGDAEPLAVFRGYVTGYSGGVYYLEMWPE